MTKSVKLSDIRIDGGTQARAALDEATVADYAEAIADGAEFPPVTVFFDGSAYWLADGFHRYHAHRTAKAVEIAADVREGTSRDAILHSVGANANHGLRRSNADKRKAVETLLADAEWSKWSDREIARRCAVGADMVGRLRPADTVAERQYTHPKTGAVTTMQTAGINAGRKESGVENQEITPEPVAPQGSEGGGEPIAAQEEITSDNDDLADLIAELKEANLSLENENAKLKARIKEDAELERMRKDWREGGFEKVIETLKAQQEQVVRAQASRIERESTDKQLWARSSDMWKKRAEEAGWSGDIVIPIPGRAVNG